MGDNAAIKTINKKRFYINVFSIYINLLNISSVYIPVNYFNLISSSLNESAESKYDVHTSTVRLVTTLNSCHDKLKKHSYTEMFPL